MQQQGTEERIDTLTGEVITPRETPIDTTDSNEPRVDKLTGEVIDRSLPNVTSKEDTEPKATKKRPPYWN